MPHHLIHLNDRSLSRKAIGLAIDRCSEDALIASGSNVRVYCIMMNGHPTVVKELLPVGLIEQGILFISEAHPHRVSIQKTAYAGFLWLKAKRRFRTAYRLTCKLQKDSRLAGYLVPVHACIAKNGTLYSVSAIPPGRPMDTVTDLTANDLIRIIIHIADMTELIHQHGWLVTDIKASNCILYPDQTPPVRVTDLDSAVPLRRVRNTKRFMCSNETAPRELLMGFGEEVGTQSDLFSIAAMLTTALAKHPITDNCPQLFDERIAPQLAAWKPNSVAALRVLLLSSLESDPHRRLKSCRSFSVRLTKICEMEGIPL